MQINAYSNALPQLTSNARSEIGHRNGLGQNAHNSTVASQRTEAIASQNPAMPTSLLAGNTVASIITQTQESSSASAKVHSPAQQARAAIEANPALADQPFGRIVSLIARGLPLEPTPTDDTGLDAPVGDVPDVPETSPADRGDTIGEIVDSEDGLHETTDSQSTSADIIDDLTKINVDANVASPDLTSLLQANGEHDTV